MVSKLVTIKGKIASLGKKKLIALSLAAVMCSLPLFALASPDVREMVAEALGISADESLVATSDITPLSGGFDADGWPLPDPAEWSGLRIPAEFDQDETPYGRFNAVTGQVLAPDAPVAWDLVADFSAITPETIAIATNQQAQVQEQAQFRLDPVTQTAELYRLPMTAPRTLAQVAGTVTIPPTVDFGGVTYTVVSIGSNAVGVGTEVERTGWLTITIPNTVTHIQAEAFLHSATTNFTFMPPVTGNLVYIGDRAFQYSGSSFGGSMRMMVLSPARAFPDGLREVGTGVYTGRNYNAVNFNITIPQSLEVVGVEKFVPPNPAAWDFEVAFFGPHYGSAGLGSTSLTVTMPNVIEIPSAWTQVPAGLFGMPMLNANGLSGNSTGIYLPDSITHIHCGAFSNMSVGLAASSATVFNWPDNLEHIGSRAFTRFSPRGPAVADFLDFPSSLRVIGNETFHNMNFGNGTTPPSPNPYLDLRPLADLEQLGTGAFGTQGGSFNLPGWMWHEDRTAIPSNWTAIPADTFINMRNANNENIVLDLSGTNIRYIGNRAFNYTNITMSVPASAGFAGFIASPHLEWIGNNAFMDQRNMQFASLENSSLIRIGNNAMRGWTSVSGDLILPDGLEQIGAQAFQASTWDGTLYIPSSVMYFGHVRATWNSIPFPLHRSWLVTNFSEIQHGRYVRPMVGNLPSVDDRFTGTPVTDGWEDTYSISTTDPVLYKSARWTDNHL
ncbi:MAG: leucine-rich repeat domain-containing protein, partial [Coriobacteriia bacterium]|nr:leucine-rich repeat domain-containing protein [Coriobacteriia bacterium]